MTTFVIRRLVRAVIVLWGVSTVVFVVTRLSGDPVALLVAPDTPPQQVQQLRHELGLDAPLTTQYGVFLKDAITGNFGRSFGFGDPALSVVVQRLQPTLELALTALALILVVAIPLGILSAVKANSPWDHLAMTFAALGQSMPTFFLGIVLLLVFAVQLHWLSTGGRGSWAQLILPAITLSTYAIASVARLTRSAMLEVLQKDYVRTARAKGVAEMGVVLRHALKNAAAPIVTIVALQFGFLLGGAVVTETIFSWPGMGRLVVQAISSRDYPIVQAAVLLSATWFVLLNTFADLLYVFLDPRVRFERR